MTPLPDDVRALFEGPNYAHLATVLPNGAPHSVPVWTNVEGDHVVFFTQPETRKARNLERDPRVAFSIADHDAAVPDGAGARAGRRDARTAMRRSRSSTGWRSSTRASRSRCGSGDRRS